MKKTFFKITIRGAGWFVTGAEDLKLNIDDWVHEYGPLSIREVQMTQEKFDSLPEYEGP